MEPLPSFFDMCARTLSALCASHSARRRSCGAQLDDAELRFSLAHQLDRKGSRVMARRDQVTNCSGEFARLVRHIRNSHCRDRWHMPESPTTYRI